MIGRVAIIKLRKKFRQIGVLTNRAQRSFIGGGNIGWQ